MANSTVYQKIQRSESPFELQITENTNAYRINNVLKHEKNVHLDCWTAPSSAAFRIMEDAYSVVPADGFAISAAAPKCPPLKKQLVNQHALTDTQPTLALE